MKNKNPFSKQNALEIEEAEIVQEETTTPAVDKKIDNTGISDDSLMVLKFLKDKHGVECSDDQIAELDSLPDRKDKIQWLKTVLVNKYTSVLDKSMHELTRADAFKQVKNPFDITCDELESLVKFKSNEEHSEQIKQVLAKVRQDMTNKALDNFVKIRDKRLENGELDTFVGIQDLKTIQADVEEKLKIYQRDKVGIRDADKLSGLVNTLNEMSVESRYRFEGYKEGVCNDFGITPESFDVWFKAICDDNLKKLDTTGVVGRTDLYDVKDFMKKHKHLLVVADGWKPGDILYVSEFNKKIREIDEEEMRESEKHATPEGKKLYSEMVKDTFRSPDKALKLSDLTGVSSDVTQKFLSRRKKTKRIAYEVKPIETNTEKVTEPVKELPPVDVGVDLLSVMDDLSKEEVKPMQDTPKEITVDKEPEQVVDKPKDDNVATMESMQATIKALQEQLAAIHKQSVQTAEIDKKEEPSKIDFKPIEPQGDIETSLPSKKGRYEANKSVIDDYSSYVEYEPDPSILRSSSNRLEVIRKYRESAKRGRTLFLPNSNYEVYVKKIKSTESIGYMITLLNNLKDMNLVDAYVKSEVLRVLYENIEFDFREPVSYTDFTKCLHESDLTLLMVMLALVNIPEDKEGRVPLTIKSVMCTNLDCGAIGNLKEDLVLDLKEEFLLIYPIELYASKFAAYKNADYPTIHHAYRAGRIGHMERIVVSDDILTYNCIASAPTIYKTQAVKSGMRQCAYSRLLESLENRVTSEMSNDRIILDIKDFMKANTYQEYTRISQELVAEREAAEMGEEPITHHSDRMKTICARLEEELQLAVNGDLPLYLIMPVIDQISVTTKDGEEVISKLDHTDLFTLLGVINDCPRELIDKIIEISSDTRKTALPVDITFSAEELAGKFDFDEYYGSDEDMVAEIHRRFEARGKKDNTEEIEAAIKAQRKLREASKDDYENKAICFCKNDSWKLNYTGILFFFLSNLSLTLVS